ncbi:MAG: hypothetical protein GEU88_00985 [Solirubrobacterales bacterium]|nr:hypothetical protein [Solirubrobacterales bacterium]
MIATSARPALITDPPAAARSAQRLFEPGGVSLEETILRTWEDLTGPGRTECPVCGGRMRVAHGCEACGSQLS